MRKKTIFAAALALFALFAVVSCNRYEKVPENAPFVVSCSVEDGWSDGAGAVMTLLVEDGSVNGDCILSLSITDTASGRGVSDYRIETSGGNILAPGDRWAFGRDGLASFIVAGLPAGSYHLSATVTRWYHSATAEADFCIND